MMDYSRIIDVNINRAREGLRVIEEIARFILEDDNLTKTAKKLRHNLSYKKLATVTKDFPDTDKLISSRDSVNDIGANAPLKKRDNLLDITQANFSRVKESLRVLEEFSKTDRMFFQKLRFDVYELEKKVLVKIF